MCTPLAGGLTGWGISEYNQSQRRLQSQYEPKQTITQNYYGSNTPEQIGKGSDNSQKTNKSKLTTGSY